MNSAFSILHSAFLLVVIMAGCATGPAEHCRQPMTAQDMLEKEHAARAEFTSPEPERGDKGPNPEGIEAIALLEKRMLDAHARECPPKNSPSRPIMP
jgi:hypothetical protein